MSSLKRRPVSDLNHDNWADEEEPEEKGVFKKASEEELKQRVIRTARRRLPAGDSNAPKPVSAFGSFAGFSSTTATKPASALFASIISNATTAGSGSVSTSTVDNKMDKNETYHRNLVALNRAVSECIKQHVDKNPMCLLTPIFNDYERHLKRIQAESNSDKTTNTMDTTQSSTKPTFPSLSATIGDSKNNGNDGSKGDDAPKTNAVFSGFKFNTTPTATTTNNDSTPKTSLFSFGSAAAPADTKLAPAPSTGFSFGNLSGGATKPFSFGSSITGPSPVAAKAEDNDDDDEEDNEEQKAAATQVATEEDAIYSKRCKLFFKQDDKYKERGIGTLYVKRVPDSGRHQLIVRADTSLGNILANFMLTKALPVKKMGANNIMMVVCKPHPDFDGTVSVLFKVKASEDADELLENLQNYATD